MKRHKLKKEDFIIDHSDPLKNEFRVGIMLKKYDNAEIIEVEKE